MKKKPNEIKLGNYKLMLPELMIRVANSVFTIKKNAKIKVLQLDDLHGNVLIDYGSSRITWKHASVLKDFKKVK